ncbi:MAG: VOC family protein [Bacteroidia bacterium]|nr:MAG: VOC family protein [Bacteroidia bacterium]
MKEYMTFASFSIDDIEVAKKFYSEKLGLVTDVHEHHDALMVNTAGNTKFLAYVKEDHKPADHTVLVFSVNHIEDVVDDLSQKGVVFQQVMGTNERGIAEEGPTKSAWFKDPAGNWMAIHEGS